MKHLSFPYTPGKKVTFRNNALSSMRVEVITASGDVFNFVLGLGNEVSFVPVGEPTISLFDADPEYSGLTIVSNEPD